MNKLLQLAHQFDWKKMLNQENALETIDFHDYNLKYFIVFLFVIYFKIKKNLYLPPGLVGPNISLIFSIVGTIWGLLKQLPLKISHTKLSYSIQFLSLTNISVSLFLNHIIQ